MEANKMAEAHKAEFLFKNRDVNLNTKRIVNAPKMAEKKRADHGFTPNNQ